MNRKKRVGWFTFTCCEDSTILFTELLNTHWKEWKNVLEFIHARVLRKDDTHDIQPMDIAFVEGAISSDSQEKKLKIIREKAKILVAVGSCAVTGSPSNQRNFFNRENMEEIQPVLDRFHYKSRVSKLADSVPVDDSVPGCPMDEKIFLSLMKKYLYA